MTNLKKPIPFYFSKARFEQAKDQWSNQLQLQNEINESVRSNAQLKNLSIDFSEPIMPQIETFLELDLENRMNLSGRKLIDLYELKLPLKQISQLDAAATEPKADDFTKFLETSEHKQRFDNFQNLKKAFENFKELNNPHVSAIVHAFPNQCYFNHSSQTVMPNTDYILGIKQRSY